MSGWFVRWILSVAGIILTTYFIKGFDVTLLGAIIGSIVFGVINATIRPFLLLLTLPINILSLGLFTLVINGLMLWLVSAVVKGFELHSFGAAILAALLLMVINSLISFVIKK